jgi:hypothetical protein
MFGNLVLEPRGDRVGFVVAKAFQNPRGSDSWDPSRLPG